jgi:hypothetical protein
VDGDVLTCGPSGVLNLQISPLPTFHAFPLLGGIKKSCFLTRSASFRFFNRSYSSLGGWRGESACVGKYAGAGGMDMLTRYRKDIDFEKEDRRGCVNSI